jgi:metal-responsive CopG/Arc/MetJ family transcriptional regulator
MPGSGSFQISGYTTSVVSKILVSVDDKLLARIDRAARSAGLSRSAYLSRLAARDLGEDRGPGASRQARRAVARLQKLFDTQPSGEDATLAIRADRDVR